MGRYLPYTIAMVTPFTKEGHFDVKAVPTLVNYMVNGLKAPGLLVCGSTGEQHVLTINERIDLLRITRASVSNDYQLYAGVASFKTSDSMMLAKVAEEEGYQAVMLGFPPYRLPTQREAADYVNEICKLIPDTSVFLYNNPRRTGFSLDVDTLMDLVKKNPNIHGIKEAGSKDSIPHLKSVLGDSLEIMSGSDASIISDIQLGYSGTTSILANVFPEKVSALVDAAITGNISQSILQTQKEVAQLASFFSQHGTLSCIKYILRKRNVSAGFCASPLKDPPSDIQALLDKYV